MSFCWHLVRPVCLVLRCCNPCSVDSNWDFTEGIGKQLYLLFHIFTKNLVDHIVEYNKYQFPFLLIPGKKWSPSHICLTSSSIRSLFHVYSTPFMYLTLHYSLTIFSICHFPIGHLNPKEHKQENTQSITIMWTTLYLSYININNMRAHNVLNQHAIEQ